MGKASAEHAYRQAAESRWSETRQNRGGGGGRVPGPLTEGERAGSARGGAGLGTRRGRLPATLGAGPEVAEPAVPRPE